MFIFYKVIYVGGWVTYITVVMDNLIPARKQFKEKFWNALIL